MDSIDLNAYVVAPQSASHKILLTESVGRGVVGYLRGTLAAVSYVGELTYLLIRLARHPKTLRWRDWLRIVQASGLNALPIIVMIGFLLGLILAFQAAIPLRLFGADLYVASMVGVSIIRELGPLMTAIVLTGRSGSAFAAELGAMRVNEEIDALETFGIEPVRFLVVPRVLAGTLVAPILTLFANFSGLLGGLFVMLTLGFPNVVFWNQVRTYVTYVDLLEGLLKATAFGFLLSAVGCLRGLQAGRDAGAVGRAATRAVVSGIILIVIADGLFAVLLYCLRA